jgi:FMN phosphatase YigB (HAD superfamily)
MVQWAAIIHAAFLIRINLPHSDYYGARNAGMKALLLRRPDYDYDSSEDGEHIKDIEVIHNLDAVHLRLQ